MKRFNIPSTFSLSNDIELNNPDFHLVKLRIMSSGENYNGSSFTINSLNRAKNSVAYTPILANIIEREDGQLDANGHDINLEINMDYNGNVVCKETYIERPVGVFLNDTAEVMHDVENDVYFIQAYGVLWKTYSDAYEVLKRDEVKDVSVEIECYDGAYREDGYYEIYEYNILGTTILGNGCLPAIENSRIEFNFSMNNDYQDKLNQISALLKDFLAKGGEEVEENKEFEQEILDEIVEEVVEETQEFAEEEGEEEVEVCEECGKPIEECECDGEEEFEQDVQDEEEKEEFEQEIEEAQEEPQEEFTQEPQEEIKVYTQEELDEAIANVREEYAQMVAELEELKAFKAEYDKAIEVQKLNNAMDELVVNFNVEEELVKELREKVLNGEYTIEQFELQLYRNAKPIEKKEFKKENNKLPIIDKEEKMSDIDRFFDYYGVTKNKYQK